ncbi:MAG: CYTH domain-containing protein [Lachnospiraceae bacterium]|nr:CYTH domain-containing protein [Lachnospiraceae bacterium]
MEIERKFTVKTIPLNLSDYPCRKLEQGYLNTAPVVRVRREDDDYYLTYKGKGFLVREEYNLPLTQEAYLHLREKADGLIITKDRYLIPYDDKLTIELDIFSGPLAPLVLAEVEFPTEEEANAFIAPDWFDKDVTNDPSFTNSALSQMF